MPHLFSYRDDSIYSHHTIDHVPRQEDYVMHAHEWMEIYYFLSGSGSYLVEGTTYPLHPNDILIMRSAETHTLTISPDAPYERIAIHFSPTLLEGLAPGSQLLQPFLDRPLGQHNCYPASEDPQGRLRSAFSAFTFADISNIRINLVGRLMLFLTTLQGAYDKDSRFTYAPTQSLSGKLVTYVNEHLFDPLSLQSLSDTFYRSRSQISRIFQQTTGSPLWEYVTIKRLLAARAMIQRGESAGNACTTCGFTDYSSFYRAYRAHFGHAPREDAPQQAT